jgi:hypothetical protein
MTAKQGFVSQNMRNKIWRHPLACGVMTAMLLSASAGQTHAQFVVVAGGKDAPLKFEQDFTWDWPALGLTNSPGNWTQDLADAAGAAGTRVLTVQVRHDKRPPGHPAAEAQPNAFMTMKFPGVTRPGGVKVTQVTKAAQTKHNRHWDTAYTTLNVLGVGFPAGNPNATIITEGKHTDDRPAISMIQHQWYYYFGLLMQPLFRDEAGNIVAGEYFGSRPILPDELVYERLSMEFSGMPLTGFSILAQGATLSTTTLAYTGQVEDQSSQLNFGLGTLLFTANGAHPVPFFYVEENDLYVAVDLTQYMGARPPFEVGQEFSFEEGICEDLPGVLVSYVPISFDPSNGFFSEMPYAGSLRVEGIVGGKLMPAISGRITLEDHSTHAAPLVFKIRSTMEDAEFDSIITPQADGSYEIEGIPSGSYNIWVKGDRWLAQSLSVEVPELQPDAPVVLGLNLTLIGGDANNDNSVDVFDLDALIQAFDATPDNSNWNGGAADFNGDGSVDVFDLDLLIRNFDLAGAPDPDVET